MNLWASIAILALPLVPLVAHLVVARKDHRREQIEAAKQRHPSRRGAERGADDGLDG